MPYPTSTLDQQYQPLQDNMHVPEQNNYDGYLHSASPDTASISNSPYTPTIRHVRTVSLILVNFMVHSSKICS